MSKGTQRHGAPRKHQPPGVRGAGLETVPAGKLSPPGTERSARPGALTGPESSLGTTSARAGREPPVRRRPGQEGPPTRGPRPGGLAAPGLRAFGKREPGVARVPVEGWHYPAAAVAWMVSAAVPGEVGAGLPPAAASETRRARREEPSAPRRRRGAATSPRRGRGDATTPRRGRRGPAAAGWGRGASATPGRGRRGPAAAVP